MPEMSPEEALMKRIETGSCVSADFETIMNHGDRDMKEALLRKEKEALENKKHLERMYGRGSFDNYDNEGKPFKHISINDVL